MNKLEEPNITDKPCANDVPKSLRQATLADCPLIRQLAQQAFPATYAPILTPAQIDYMMEWMYSIASLERQMRHEGHVYFLAFEGGEAVGYVSVQPQGTDVFHLQKIYVLPRFQGHRIGELLFGQAIRAIKQMHPAPCRMELNVNRHNKALHFYEKMGMHKAGEGDFDIGNGFFMNDFIMAMDI